MTMSRRPPGGLPNLIGKVESANQALQRLPVAVRAQLEPVVRALESVAREQDRFNRYQWGGYDSLPAKHGETHLGGADNIVSKSHPEPLTPTTEGDAGTAQEGAAARGHLHDMSAFAGLEGLAGASSEQLNGLDVMFVYSPAEDRLLSEILIALMRLTGELD